MPLTCLIVTYNSANEVPELLADLQLHVPSRSILVIDNASKDRTAEIVRSLYPDVRIVVNKHNVGYAKAVNQGFDWCDSKYVFLFNPDVRILTSEIFKDALEHMESSSKTAAVAPLQYDSVGNLIKLRMTWSYTSPQTFRFYVSNRLGQKEESSRAISTTYLNAGCILIRKSAFLHVGKLNERYFLYGEEPDLFLKFKRYGYKSFLLSSMGVIHYRERSLMSINETQRLWLRLVGIFNICDALVRGWVRILFDYVLRHKPG